MPKQARHIRVSDQCLAELYQLSKTFDLGSLSSTLEFLVQDYVQLQKERRKFVDRLESIEKVSTLNKKYLNELRRNSFLLLDLLNAICMEQNIPFCPPHTNKDFRARALQLAYENLDHYMQEVLTKNKD